MQPTTIKIHQDTSRLQTPHRESETASATDRQICNIKFGILTDVPSTQPAQRVGRAAVPVATVGRASGTSVYPRPCRALSAPTNSHVGGICWKCARNARNFDRTFNTRALSGQLVTKVTACTAPVQLRRTTEQVTSLYDREHSERPRPNLQYGARATERRCHPMYNLRNRPSRGLARQAGIDTAQHHIDLLARVDRLRSVRPLLVFQLLELGSCRHNAVARVEEWKRRDRSQRAAPRYIHRRQWEHR